MFRSTKLVTDAFAEKELKYDVRETSTSEIVSVAFASNETYYFICHESNNDITVRSSILGNVPENKVDQMLVILNNVNRKMHFVVPYLDEDRDVVLQLDIPHEISDRSVGAVALEALLRIKKAHEDIYPQVMKCIWG